MHYQYRFNQLLDALAGVVYLVHGARQGAHPLLGVVVPTLLELDPGTCLVLDLLDHFAILADDYADCRSRDRHLSKTDHSHNHPHKNK